MKAEKLWLETERMLNYILCSITQLYNAIDPKNGK